MRKCAVFANNGMCAVPLQFAAFGKTQRERPANEVKSKITKWFIQQRCPIRCHSKGCEWTEHGKAQCSTVYDAKCSPICGRHSRPVVPIAILKGVLLSQANHPQCNSILSANSQLWFPSQLQSSKSLKKIRSNSVTSDHLRLRLSSHLNLPKNSFPPFLSIGKLFLTFCSLPCNLES